MQAGRQEENEDLVKAVCMLCVCMQGDGFMSALSRSVLLRGSDMLTVLDLSENGIGDNGAAALAATLAAAGARILTHIANGSSTLVAHSCSVLGPCAALVCSGQSPAVS